MMTVELANYLIGLEKYIWEENKKLERFFLDISYPINFRLTLSTPEDLDQKLLIDVKESEKQSLKISLHHQDDTTKNGLLRIDFHSRHLNPFEITPKVPELFRPFAGKWLDDYAGHIHYVVDGYKPLAWAIPLELDEFPIKKLNSKEDYIQILSAFFHKVNLKTKVQYNNQMRIL